jgi:hypothetical protein
MLQVPLTAALVMLVTPSFAGRITPAGVTASSTYPEENGIPYDAARMVDGKLSTAWVEGEQGGGLGSWVELDLGAPKKVHEIRLYGGMWYSGEYWARGNRPKEIEVAYGDGTKDTFTLKDEMKVQRFVLVTPKTTNTVRIKLKSVYDGSTWLDTAISEVQVFDAELDGRAIARAVTASSSLPSDADGSYDPMNVQDGLTDSMWCEANRTGDGAGEWLQYEFGASTSVSKLTVVNGIGTSMAFWMKANRATAATVTFSDGATESLTLKNSMLPQTVAFPAHATTSAKVAFTTIAKGKEFNDLCISEASFSE